MMDFPKQLQDELMDSSFSVPEASQFIDDADIHLHPTILPPAHESFDVIRAKGMP